MIVQSSTLYIKFEEGVFKIENRPYEDVKGEMVEVAIPLGYQSKGSIVIRYLTNDLFKDVKKIHIVNYMLVILGACFSLILTIGLSKYKAKRINKLEDIFDIKYELPDIRDEYTYLRTLIRNMVKESDRFLNNELLYKKTLLQQNAQLLFKGDMDQKEEIMTFLRISGVELCEEYFFVCAFLVNEIDEKWKDIIIGDVCYSQATLEKSIFY